MICLHHNDMDGRSAASLVAQYENNYNSDNYIEMDYGSEIPYEKIKKDEKVYIVDYSFTKKSMYKLEKLLNITKNIIWIDHHQSSVDLITRYPNLVNDIKYLNVVNKNISGAALTYMNLYNKSKLEDCPRYIQLISDYDCWVYKFGKETDYFKLGMDSIPQNPTSNIWKKLNLKYNIFTLIKIKKNGRIISKYIKTEYEDYMNKFSFDSSISGYNCICINRKANSKIFGSLIDLYPIVCTVVYNGKDYEYSIYTNKDYINCQKIAERLGGGGHKKAAGFHNNKMILRKE